MIKLTTAALLFATSGIATAQEAQDSEASFQVLQTSATAAEVEPAPEPAVKSVTLPANSEVVLLMAEELSS